MAAYALTARAKADIGSIARFTLERWGETQVELYLDQMEHVFQLLANGRGWAARVKL
jgi:toxin ParE1/3/4